MKKTKMIGEVCNLRKRLAVIVGRFAIKQLPSADDASKKVKETSDKGLLVVIVNEIQIESA